MLAQKPITAPLRVLIAEDHEFTRTGLIYSLQSKGDFEIVGEAENGEQALKLAEQLQPDIILMDIGMPNVNGITATQEIKKRWPHIKVLMLTSRQVTDEIFASLSAGADAYCMKDISTKRLIQVMDVISEGAIWLDPAIAKIVVKALPAESGGRGKRLPASSGRPDILPMDLTQREYDVLELIATGRSNKEIGEALGISTHTVKIHVRNLTQKLAVDDRTQAAIKALQEGLV